MSVFNLNAAAVSTLFNEYILPGVQDELYHNTKLYGRWGDANTKDCYGTYAVFKCMTAAAKSVRPSSSSTFPTAKQGTYDQFRLYMKRALYASLQFDNFSIACSKGQGAVTDVVKQEMEGIKTQIGNKLNRQFWGDGSGRLATINGAVSNSTSVEVDGPYFGQDSNWYTNPANYLDEGQQVDIYDTSGNLEAEDVEITTILDNGDGTATLTMAEAVTCSDNSYFFDHDTYAASQVAGTGVPMGLRGIINTADPYTGITETAFQNVDRDTYKWARAQTVAMGSVAVTNRKILETIQKVDKFGRVEVIFCNEPIWNSYYENLETDKTMPNEKDMWGGLTGLYFYGGKKGAIPILSDSDCPDNTMFMFDDKILKVYSPTKTGMMWLPGDSGNILSQVQGKDEKSANLLWYSNFGSPKPQALGYLSAIKHSSS